MSQSISPSREKKLLFLLALIQFTNIMDFMIMMPLGPQLMRMMAMNPAQFSLVVSGYTFAAGISGFMSAFFLDRFDRKKALLSIYVGFMAGTTSCALAPNYEFLVAARVLTGFFGGVMGALVLSIVGDVIPLARRGRAMGIVMTSFSAAAVIGVPSGLALANIWSWHAPFVLLALTGMPVLLLGILWIPPLRGHLESAEGEAKAKVFGLIEHLIKDKKQAFALLLTPTLMLGHFTIVPFMSPYLVSNVGLTENQLTYVYFLGGVATLFSSPLVGRLSDRWGSGNVFTFAALLATGPILWVTHLGVTPLHFVLMVTTCMFIVSSARMVPSMSLVTSAVKPRWRGGFMSLNGALQQLGVGIASYVGGIMIGQGADGTLTHYDWVGYLAAGASVLCIFIARRIRPFKEEPTHGLPTDARAVI